MKPSAPRRALIGLGALQALGVRAQALPAGSAPGSAAASAADPAQQVLDRWRAAAASAAAAETPERRAQRLRERSVLLDRGEAALSRGEVEPALAAFERAAQMLHAADTEMSLVRAYMQAGEYRRAVSFGAHTAGAHRQVVAGAVLYGWLLSQGGQEAIATQLLDTAAQTEAPDTLLDRARHLLATPGALPQGALLAAPVRLAPYARGAVVPRGARIAGSAVLIGDGRHALVPEATLRGARALWLRNGLGDTVRAGRAASADPRTAALGVALLRLDAALPTATLPAASGRDPFPGSPGCAVNYTAASDAQPAWPRLHLGFHGMPEERGSLRDLGIALPTGTSGARSAMGGPVFDAVGRWVGMALPHVDGRPRIAMRGALQLGLGGLLSTRDATVAASTQGARAPIDEVYENALRVALQLVVLA